MKDLVQRIARVATVLLASSMLLVAVVKAQGCRKDEKMLPATKAGPFMEGEPQATPANLEDDMIDGTLRSPATIDAGTADTGSDAGAADKPSMHMMPASKSGGFMLEPSGHGGMGLHGTGPTNSGPGIGLPQDAGAE